MFRLVNKKLLIFLSRLNEINGCCGKIEPDITR